MAAVVAMPLSAQVLRSSLLSTVCKSCSAGFATGFRSTSLQEVLPKNVPAHNAKINVMQQPIEVLRLAREIADARTREKNDDAFMLFNLDALYDRFKLWKRELPRIEPFYAVKCNNDETMLRSMAALGLGFDCASREEIDIVMRLGVSADRIIYAHPCKSRAFIGHADERGVNLMMFDNAEELEKIANYHTCPEVVLRIAVSDPTASHQFAAKFGADPIKAAPALLKRAATLGIPVHGVSFHVGCGCNDPTTFRVAIQHVRNLFDLGHSLGHPMHMVNVGGGFPGGAHRTPFEKIAAVIRSAIDHFFPDPNVRVIAEPGTFFAMRPVTLVANVMARTAVSAERITKRASDAGSTGHMYYINDGVFGSFICVLSEKLYPPGRPLFDADGPLFPSVIWGPTCDSHDKLEENIMMRKLREGDWIVYEDMGAYTSAASTSFNGFPRPTPIYVVSERTWKELSV